MTDPTPQTRAEYQAQLEAEQEADPTTRAGFLARSRKAIVGGIAAAATALAAAVPGQVADGVYTEGEFWFTLTVTLGAAVVGFATVWRIPNAT